MNLPDLKQITAVSEDLAAIAHVFGVSAVVFFGFAFLGLCALQVMP